MKKITMLDVAKRANVSKSTVSQYLNGRYDYMGEKTRKRIEKAIAELNYQPNIVARSLKQKRTSTIGVIIANILHSFSTEVIRAIEDICHQHDYHVIVCNADDEPEKEKKYIEMLKAKQVDGLIVFPTGGNLDLYQSMVSENYPLVFIDRSVPGIAVDSVLLNNEKAAKLAVDYFVQHGYERIGIVTTSLLRNITPRLERLSGYRKALEEHGLPMKDEYIVATQIEQISSALGKMFTSESPPDALLAANDLALMEVLEFVKENQLEIPNQIALIGIDNTAFAHIYSPTLTTIKQPTFEMGKKAAERLFESIEGKSTSKQTVICRFEPEIIERESVKKQLGKGSD
ncbi:LacI family DNA-binding transcriptional regulator [Halalkalibacterium ligniniphilum]|uniref:LacI family DNA-binding transcriptional regulator n=1 Tax=Halalkalibacterium ligniniphilum TaxID=1134413 RepID=UPI0003486E0B|nr:substrate-binding domain-containing protein [Halalkalibacterium ligniniphilum]